MGSHSATKERDKDEKSTQGNLKSSKTFVVEALLPLHWGAVGVHFPSGVQSTNSSPTST
jgi:hypothetical protein